MKQVPQKIVLIGLIVLCLFSIARFFDNGNSWMVDIFSHFSVQYAVAAFLLLAVCFWKRMVSLAIASGLLFAFNVGVLGDVSTHAQAAGPARKSFIVYSANINKTNRNFTKLIAGLKESDADVLLILEATEKNIGPLQPVIQKYPYKIIELNTCLSGTGAVLLSKFPVLHHEVTTYSEFGNILISATLEIQDEKVMFYGTHFPKPINYFEFQERARQITLLARGISEQSLPVIIAGDFNATPYSPSFKKFIHITGLKDSREGFGWQPSWPTFFPPLWIPIDHILVSPDIKVHKRKTGSYTGSDHYPVLAELSIRNIKNGSQ